jgi:hypothetical protein
MAKSLSKTDIETSLTVKAAHVSQSIDAFTGIDDYNIKISGSLTVTGSTNLTGSLNITHGVTGSYTGSFVGDGSGLTGVTGEWDGSRNGNSTITGSLILSGSGATKLDVKGDISASGNITASGYISGSSVYATDGLKTNAISNADAASEIITFGSCELKQIGSLLCAGTITASRFTGSNGFYGTSSWAVSSSTALTASHIANAASFPFSGSAVITGSLVVTGSVSLDTITLLCSGAASSPATQLPLDAKIVFLRNTRTDATSTGQADLDLGPFVTSAENVGRTVDIYWQKSGGTKDTFLKNVGMSATTHINGLSVSDPILIKSSSGDDNDLQCWVRIVGMGYESCSIVSNQLFVI